MPIKLSSLRALLLASSTAFALIAIDSPALAEEPSALSFSANAALVSDYRFRGISLSNKDIAIQGGFDISSNTGFYIGSWGSSIEHFNGAELELDIYGGYATSIKGLEFDVGILAYTYASSENTTYWEAYSSLDGSTGTLAWTLGAAYAFDQTSIGSDDNIYVYLDASLPINVGPLSLATHLAYEDGAFGNDKFDWSLGINYDFEKFSIGVAYVDTNIDTREGKAGVIASLSSSF